jgi:GR25 family glycosyltransferase involved in LPS biosynthesis
MKEFENLLSVFILGLELQFRGTKLVEFFHLHEINPVVHFGFNANISNIPNSWRNDKRSLRLYRKILTNQEIACTHGHRSMLKLASQKDTDFSLFLEDDIRVVSFMKLIEFISTNSRDKPTVWIFPLEAGNYLRGAKYFVNIRCYLSRSNIPSGAFAYLVNSSAIKELEYGYAKYGFEGYVADFPTFFPDFVDFQEGPSGLFKMSDTESVLGELKERQRRKVSFYYFAKKFSDLFFMTWLLSGHRDSGIRGYCKLHHGSYARRILFCGKVKS